MRSASEPIPPEAFALERGRLAGRPGLDFYVYVFDEAPVCNLPIGGRGDFVTGAQFFPARVVDRRGPQLTLSLTADKPLGASISGLFHLSPFPSSIQAPEESSSPGLRQPLGASCFLDSHDGWVMSATEAASQPKSFFEPDDWPLVERQDLPAHLSPAGLTFIWRPKPADNAATLFSLMDHFLMEHKQILVASEAPADLESLAQFTGAIFMGVAAPGTALHPASVYTKMAEDDQAREVEQAELRQKLSLILREEAQVKADLARWDDLMALESSFKQLAHDVERCREEWEKARREVERAGAAWQEAEAVTAKNTRGLLGWLYRGRADEALARQAEAAQNDLNEAEIAMRAVRQEEDTAVGEARRLDQKLNLMRLDSESWPGKEMLQGRLDEVRNRQGEAASQLAAAVARPRPTPEDWLAQARVVLALASDMAPGEILAHLRFPVVMQLISSPPDHEERQRLAATIGHAEHHWLVLGDFTGWPIWSGRAPALPGHHGVGAWSSLIVAEEADELLMSLARGQVFDHHKLPEKGPKLSRLELGEGRGDYGGFGFRAVGEIGPANPVSALAVAKAAINFTAKGYPSCSNLDSTLKDDRPRAWPYAGSGIDPAVIILTASAAQSRLINLMLSDLGAEPGRIFCGEPANFAYWPQVPLVILEPAFEAPHTSHPWGWPSFGRQRLIRAWQLARDHLWLAGRPDWMKLLPGDSPLGVMWGLADQSAPAEFNPALSFPMAVSLEKYLTGASREIWAVLPLLEPSWWPPMEEHFWAAARRKVPITILTPPPKEMADNDFVAQALRKLGNYGVQIILAQGFPGLLVMADEHHLVWGQPPVGAELQFAEIPLAGPAIGHLLQNHLIFEKLGRRGGGMKICQQCGWPEVLVNQDKTPGLLDEQPLKVSCLGCPGPKGLRRLDEREPFLTPPRCGLEPQVLYQRVWRKRQELWVCPQHPNGRDCPNIKVRPGDVK